ncbi:MAG: hypothetical protein ACI4MP_13360 [Candidatus Ventricola sp.]
MKEKWEAPRIAVEEFVANDYVSACFGVSCQMGYTQGTLPNDLSATTLWGAFENDPTKKGSLSLADEQSNKIEWDDHATNGQYGNCSSSDSNFISETDTGYDIYEYNAAQQRNLNGMVTYFTDANNDNRFDLGGIFAWVTWNAKFYWRHWAYATDYDENHPNRS